MKKLRIEFHKSNGGEDGVKIFTKVVQEVGVTYGERGAFFEDGFENLSYSFISIEGYLLAFMDKSICCWIRSKPGLLCSLTFDETDFNDNGVPDVKKLFQKMNAVECAAPLSIVDHLVVGMKKLQGGKI